MAPSPALPEGLPIAIGQVIHGKYRVEAALGMGGMGFVVRAMHLELLQPVAMKFLRPEMAREADATTRFVREARAAARLTSENVGRVLDVDSSGPLAFIVMEFLEGTDLAGLIAQRGPLPIDLAIDYALQACDALAEAHAIGIVHRDLKPHNLFLARRPNGATRVKVLDFGISKVVASISGESRALTSTQAVMGSPSYMSPEQMLTTRDVDARTDIWSLGVTLFEMLTGRVPFEGETPFELGAQVLSGAPPSPRTFRPDIPPALEAIVLRCLEKAPAERFQSIAELVASLRSLTGVAHAATQPWASPAFAATELMPGPVPNSSAKAPNAATGGTWEATERQRSSPRGGGWIAVVLAAIAVVAVVVGALVVRRSLRRSVIATSESATPPPPPATAPAATPMVPATTTEAAIAPTAAVAATPASSSAARPKGTPAAPARTRTPPTGGGLPNER